MERKYAINSVKSSKIDKDSYILKHFEQNKSYQFHEKIGASENLLQELQDRYKWYRQSWRGIPQEAIDRKLTHDFYDTMQTPPLCVDLELAAICDLACPFCYRQYLATPDKYMDSELAYHTLDQCAELGVPSVKLNWRGEPLMHRHISDFVRYAKEKGILEVIINTNATHLTPKMSRELIEGGLDVMIYSFDGGTAETYNKMRVGRFNPNNFKKVYQNIRNFAEIRQEMGAVFPFTIIQMILTEETFGEQEPFYKLFNDCVDDVTVKAYTERGFVRNTHRCRKRINPSVSDKRTR